MNINKGLFLSFFLVLTAFILYKNTPVAVAATSTCPCVAYETYPCPGNAGCKVVYDKNGKALNHCGPGTCMRCAKTKCPPPVCHPLALDCSNACGLSYRCTSNGCGGQNCCAATAPCPPTVPPACVDSDGGSAPNVYGHVTITAPALPQVLYDSCLLMVTNGNSSGWVSQATGTHVGEKTCANVATGAYTDSVIACPNGCINGACSTVVNPCPKRPQGDANCDQAIDDGDFTVIRLKMRGGTYTAANHSADFNNDSRVNLVDYEIWRNTAKH